MVKMSYIAAVLLAASVSVAHAQTAPAPATQGDASVDKNLSKNPDNKGLQTADKKVEANEAKAADKRADGKAEKKEERKEAAKKDLKKDKGAKHEKMERPAKPEHPGR